MLAALAAAAAFYTAAAARSWVPAYLTGRGLPATAAGYAPATWTALVDHLRAAGHTDQAILAAGLARHSSRGGLIDFFHNRAVLPITRPQDGAVVAFIGRKHPDDANDQSPKYLNSPTTMLFSKSDLPFGLTPRQVAALRAGADLVIVEGPMDALAVNVARPDLVAVAPLGTALTPGHLATLNTIAPLADRRVLLALDNDKAGRAASVRAWRALAERRRHRCRDHHLRRREGRGGTARHPRARTRSRQRWTTAARSPTSSSTRSPTAGPTATTSSNTGSTPSAKPHP